MSLCERIGNLLKGLAKPGVNEHLTVFISGPTISVKREPPPFRWTVEGSKLIRSR